MITKLTAAQEARFPEFVKKWIDIGLSTKPANRPRAERAIAGLYGLANLKEPKIIWLPCPLSAALSAVCYAAIINERLTGQKGVTRQNNVYSAVGSAVRSAVDSAVNSAVNSAVDSAVDSAVNSAVNSAVYSAVYSAVNSAVNSAVYSAVDSAVGSAVDSAVYSAVRSAVDSAVYSAVYSAVDSAVDSAVYSAVNSAVYSAVDSAVRSAVYSAGYAYFGGSLWAGHSAWADYFNEVCAVAIDRHYLETQESCGFFWTLDSVCFASERPTVINRNERGQLHCENGPSIAYPSGWGLWHLNGIAMTEAQITTPAEKLDSTACLKETNVDVRRELIRKIGVEMMLSHLSHRVLDTRGDYSVLSIDFPDLVRDARYLKMLNPSIGVWHLEGIERECNTVQQALNWRAGKLANSHDWQPAQLT